MKLRSYLIVFLIFYFIKIIILIQIFRFF